MMITYSLCGNESRHLAKVPTIRLALVTDSISHFKVPFFRLCPQVEAWECMVFYCDFHETRRYDQDYQCDIFWGGNSLAGYASRYVENRRQLAAILDAWRSDAVYVYGCGWPGAVKLIARNWLTGRLQIHRGTLNYFLDPRRGWKGRRCDSCVRHALFKIFTAHHYGDDYSVSVA